MQASKTYNHEKNDHINRANIALLCAEYFGIKEVSPSLYLIAAPVSELAQFNKNGGKIYHREEIEDAIPWDERSMKTFGVVYRRESTASFIGIDGKTYVVPNDQPVLDHLKACGYEIAQEHCNFDNTNNGDDSLILKGFIEYDEYDDEVRIGKTVDRNLPIEIVDMIAKIEGNRPYYKNNKSYYEVASFGGTMGLASASEEEKQQLSLSERKIENIKVYGRLSESQDLEEYVQFALQQDYLNDQIYFNRKKS